MPSTSDAPAGPPPVAVQVTLSASAGSTPASEQLMLPSGSTVVAFASDPTGSPGADYLDYTDWQPANSGKVWAQWVVDNLGDDGGNVVFLGGPAGASVTAQELTGIKEVLAANPKVKPSAEVAAWGAFKADSLPVEVAGKRQAEAIRLMDRAGWN